MNKVLIDRELLEKWADKLEGADSAGYGWEDLLAAEIRGAFAQPAEAEGVDVVAWRCEASKPGIKTQVRLVFTWPEAESFALHYEGIGCKVTTTALVEKAKHLAALSAVTAERDGEAESCEQWRALALQFDRHRMSALAHLKMVVAGQEGALDACRDFLAAPPVPGHEITAEIDQLRAEVEALRAMAQRANNLLRQIADSGYDDDSIDALTCWLEEHPGAKLFDRVSAMAAKEA
ncbi:hypothetical protein [Stutzerimonas nitrititolerans]|uniref:hypothetical protein n=1 Tax=Stutzerimonas nitrititolerans TaxID=2482751 RepID=UPI0028B1FB77|nr:hypothetical protein [Stutzerimonas nitrititolerans]